MKSIISLAIATMLLAGCATPPANNLMACASVAAADKKYDPIRGKISLLGTDQQTIAMLADVTYPTDGEKPLLLDWANTRQDCLQKDASDRAKMQPMARAYAEKAISMTSIAYADLYAQKITYGEFARRRQSITDTLRTNLSVLETGKQDEDEAKKRQVLLMQLQALQNKPAPTPVPQPYMIPTNPTVTTNCSTVGSQVNCVSR